MLNGSVRSLMKGDIKSGLTLPLARLNKSWNPLWNFRETMAVEEKYGARSTFFFMATHRDPYDKIYSIDDLKGEMGNILDKGWDIGLHGGYYSYDNLGSILDEKRSLEQALGKKVTGYRNHFLRFTVPDTWRLLEKAGFKYDSTLGYADQIGFRNGMCHPFRPYDLKEGRWLGITEIPLAAMADTLFNYMMLDYGRSWDAIKTLIDTVEKNRGVMTILWHNYQMGGECLKLYEKILGYCNEKGALMTSAENIRRLAPINLIAQE
jgi:peptidoglycan/xylan/chitin deacetylase (PgdA/CDA1 family)